MCALGSNESLGRKTKLEGPGEEEGVKWVGEGRPRETALEVGSVDGRLSCLRGECLPRMRGGGRVSPSASRPAAFARAHPARTVPGANNCGAGLHRTFQDELGN